MRLIITWMLFQLVFALLILKTIPGRMFFNALKRFVNGIIACGNEGSTFLFGDGFKEHYFVFSVLPLIVSFSCLTAVLFHWGVIQKIVKVLAWSMVRVMDVSGSESLAAAANVFLGHTEAPTNASSLSGIHDALGTYGHAHRRDGHHRGQCMSVLALMRGIC